MVPETESTSLNVFSAVLKNARLPAGLLAATEASGPPAPAAPLRTPGSVWAIALPIVSSVAMVSDKNGNFRLVIASSSSCFWIQGLVFCENSAALQTNANCLPKVDGKDGTVTLPRKIQGNV